MFFRRGAVHIFPDGVHNFFKRGSMYIFMWCCIFFREGIFFRGLVHGKKGAHPLPQQHPPILTFPAAARPFIITAKTITHANNKTRQRCHKRPLLAVISSLIWRF
jgi:hypothetical protein